MSEHEEESERESREGLRDRNEAKRREILADATYIFDISPAAQQSADGAPAQKGK